MVGTTVFSIPRREYGQAVRQGDAMTALTTVLIMDDEPDLVELIRFNLERRQYQVLTAADGEEGLESARRHRPGLIILDLMLPRRSGQDVAAALKADPATQHIPIIMLTARTSEQDIIVGLRLGADDYVTKPFSMEVLLARIAAVLRRKGAVPEPSDVLHAGPMRLDRSRYSVELDGAPVTMTLTEFKLLEALVKAKARVLSRDQIMSKVMGPHVAVTDRTIDVHVTSLRRKLGHHRDLVETVRGVGYRFADVWSKAQA